MTVDLTRLGYVTSVGAGLLLEAAECAGTGARAATGATVLVGLPLRDTGMWAIPRMATVSD